jgi:putative ABC transport system permease protein
LRTFPERKHGWIDFGMIRLKPGADIKTVQADLQALVGRDVSVLTRPEFVAFEKAYWQKNAPIGFIFTMGTAIGFLVGFVVVYQILHTDVANHLPQYATLKAIGFTHGFLLRVVLQESFILAVLGYLPSTVIAYGMYRVAAEATHLPLQVTASRAVLILVLTILMCFFSGSVAVRKLRSADPADVF